MQSAPCNASDPNQLWRYDAASKKIVLKAGPGVPVLDNYQCNNSPGTPVYLYPNETSGTCNGRNQQWNYDAGAGTFTNVDTGTLLFGIMFDNSLK